jgi:beta-lactamase regulating signal transducer with metallopeptidase domain
MHPAPIAEIFSLAAAAGHITGQLTGHVTNPAAGQFPAAAQLLAAAFSAFAHLVAPVAVAALWQGAAVALALALCLRFVPRISAAHRFAVWAGGFAVVVGIGVLPLFFHSAAVSAASGSRASAQPLFELDARWTLAIAALWLALAALRAADLAVHTLRLRRLWKNAILIEAHFAEGIRGRSQVPICTTTELNRPSVIGFFAPRILIPAWLFARLTPGELEQVILHECEHLRRRDDWTNLLQKFALVLFPLNPALAWMERRLCREREMACDEGVVRVTRAPRAYAACLASMAERRLEQSLSARAAAALSLGAFEGRSELVRRVQSILRRKQVLGPLGAATVLGALGCGLLAAAVELERTPQMVAFVSAQPAEAQLAQQRITPQLESGASPAVPLLFDGRSAAQFHATNAMAFLPAAPLRPAETSTRRLGALDTANRSTGAMNVAAVQPRQQQVAAGGRGAEANRAAGTNAQANSSAAEADAAPQQWIVLTTWEQVESPAVDAGTVSDYNTSANENLPAQPAQNAPHQFAVTQLILRVYPTGEAAAPGQKPNSAAQSNASAGRKATPTSDFNRQAILPLENGWLVIRL